MAAFQPKLKVIEEAEALSQTKLSPLSAEFVPRSKTKSPIRSQLQPTQNGASINALNTMNIAGATTTCIMQQQQTTTNHMLSVQGLNNNRMLGTILNNTINLTPKQTPSPQPNIVNQQEESNNYQCMDNLEIIQMNLPLSDLLEKNLIEKLISDLNGLQHIQQKLKNAAITIEKVKKIMYSPRIRSKPETESQSESAKPIANNNQSQTTTQPPAPNPKPSSPYNPIAKTLIVNNECIEHTPSPSPSTVSSNSPSSSLSTSYTMNMQQIGYFEDVHRSETLRTTTNRFPVNRRWPMSTSYQCHSYQSYAQPTAYNPFLDPKNDKLFDSTLREMRELNKETQTNQQSNMKRFGLRDESKATLVTMECNEWLQN